MGIVAPLMMIAGTGVQALSQYRQGQAAAVQARAQAGQSLLAAETADANAEAIKQKSIFDQIRAVKAGSRQIGRLRAGQTEENIANVVAEQGFENALNVALIGHEGLVGAQRQRNLATMKRNEVTNLRAAALNLRRAGQTAALTTGLSGLGQMFLLTGFGGGGGTTSHDPAVAARLDTASFGQFPTSFG
jgi:hypothetical protein